MTMLFCTMLQLPLLNLGRWLGASAQHGRAQGRQGQPPEPAAPCPRDAILLLRTQQQATTQRTPVHAAVALAGRATHDELNLAGARQGSNLLGWHFCGGRGGVRGRRRRWHKQAVG
jgi:hypothetical protein